MAFYDALTNLLKTIKGQPVDAVSTSSTSTAGLNPTAVPFDESLAGSPLQAEQVQSAALVEPIEETIDFNEEEVEPIGQVQQPNFQPVDGSAPLTIQAPVQQTTNLEPILPVENKPLDIKTPELKSSGLEAPTFNIDTELKGIANAQKLATEAISAASTIEMDRQAALSKLAYDRQTKALEQEEKMLKIQQKARSDVEMANAMIDASTQDYIETLQGKKSDWWSSKTSSERFEYGLWTILGSIGSALTQGFKPTARNYGLEIIQKSIDNDVKAKMVKIRQGKDKLSAAYRQINDDMMFQNALQTVYLNGVAAQIDKVAADTGTLAAQQKGKEMIAQLQERINNNSATLQMQAYDRAQKQWEDARRLELLNQQVGIEFLKAQGMLQKNAADAAQGRNLKGAAAQIYAKIPKEQRNQAFEELRKREEWLGGFSDVKQKLKRLEQYSGLKAGELDLPFVDFGLSLPQVMGGERSSYKADAEAIVKLLGVLAPGTNSTDIEYRRTLENQIPLPGDTPEVARDKSRALLENLAAKMTSAPLLDGAEIDVAGAPTLFEDPSEIPQVSTSQTQAQNVFKGSDSSQLANSDVNFSDVEVASIVDAIIPNPKAGNNPPAYVSKIYSDWQRLGDDINNAPPHLKDAIERASNQQGIPPGLLIALASRESGGKLDAKSKTGALGPFQFIESTGKQYGLMTDEDRMDPIKSADAAARLMTDLHDQFGDWRLALAGYLEGPEKVRNAMKGVSTPSQRKRWGIK